MTDSFASGVARRSHRAVDPAPARNVLSLFCAGVADGWHAWSRYRELSAMSDADLARLGISRGDAIRHAVLGTAGDG